MGILIADTYLSNNNGMFGVVTPIQLEYTFNAESL